MDTIASKAGGRRFRRELRKVLAGSLLARPYSGRSSLGSARGPGLCPACDGTASAV